MNDFIAHYVVCVATSFLRPPSFYPTISVPLLRYNIKALTSLILINVRLSFYRLVKSLLVVVNRCYQPLH